ncbi:MAG: DUF5715 family protein [Bacteroidota bacterium]
MRDLPHAPAALVEPRSRSRFARISPWWYIGFVLVSALAVYGARQALLVRDLIVTTDNVLERMERRLAEVPPLTEVERDSLRRSLNDAHLREAQARGIPPVIRRSRLVRMAREAGLVRLESTPRYRVLDATHSVPLVTHGTRRTLDSISVRFWQTLSEDELPGFRYSLSSLLRSAEDQAALTEVNLNAARGLSSHQYGTTVDITYIRFSYRGGPEPEMTRLPKNLAPGVRGQLRGYLQRRRAEAYRAMAGRHTEELAGALGRALIELEDEGVLLALREEMQPVYHVTALLDGDATASAPSE